MKTKKIIKMKGGIPIYPGGYSCIFKPQLRCKSKNKTKKNNRNIRNEGVSKLLFKKYADIEMQNIQKFYHALKKIHNSHKYFLFTKTKSCSPSKISTRDLKGFNEMCTNFTSHDINESNINNKKNIQNLRLINMPNAGISLNEWLFVKYKNTIEHLKIVRIKLFNKIISTLILRAIVPMNHQGVIHNDMKEDNILIHSTSPTIIDWGISGISTHHHPIPEIIMNRYISISNPFSSILFTTDFSKNYSEFLKVNAIHTTHHVTNMRHDSQIQQKLRDFSLSQYLKNKEYGHYSHIQNFFRDIFKIFINYYNNNSNEFLKFSLDTIKTSDDLYHRIASNYISDILIHFTEFDERDGFVRFQYIKYFTDVYIYNCDLWGTVFCYSVFFSFTDEYKYDKYIDIPPLIYTSFLRCVLSIFMKQIMINGHKKIKVSKLTKSIMNSI